MEKKYQVFVSSTYTDLKEERQAVVEQILKQGHIPAGMELFRADDRNQKEIIKKWIEESDIYILLLGYRYGTVDVDTGLSYTEWEYDLAEKLGKPRIVLTLSEEWLKSKLTGAELEANETSIPQYKNFKIKLRDSGRYAHEVNDISHLKLEINNNLDYTIRTSSEKLVGWVPANTLNNKEEILNTFDEKLTDYVSKNLVELIASNEEEEKINSAMDFCYKVFGNYCRKIQNETKSTKIQLSKDGRSPMESFSFHIGRHQVDVRADYYRNSIEIISLVQSLGGTASSVLARYELDESGKLMDSMRNFGNEFTVKNIEDKIEFFISSANSHMKLKKDF